MFKFLVTLVFIAFLWLLFQSYQTPMLITLDGAPLSLVYLLVAAVITVLLCLLFSFVVALLFFVGLLVFSLVILNLTLSWPLVAIMLIALWLVSRYQDKPQP